MRAHQGISEADKALINFGNAQRLLRTG